MIGGAENDIISTAAVAKLVAAAVKEGMKKTQTDSQTSDKKVLLTEIIKNNSCFCRLKCPLVSRN